MALKFLYIHQTIEFQIKFYFQYFLFYKLYKNTDFGKIIFEDLFCNELKQKQKYII